MTVLKYGVELVVGSCDSPLPSLVVRGGRGRERAEGP